MTAAVLRFPSVQGAATAGGNLEVELRFRDSYHDEGLSQGELEALGPVLPELAAELLMIMTSESTE